ncbi:FRM2 (YCL026C-A) [Zygosaccharomyces parabailii]|uniref:ZYBA0S14-01706g1_1 n=1 Tax=Zygosaccharomyces bailii (strain CLIB 213 / ATCC 58445 / CBS 680 / BCRC 21525 / NBRC 1098 / NCYC 1416 / NRRL Y-2227) TaxID=1333698 RepID=A0A8J2TB29_ZYGB2|nr:FRM2 (YCL026C-A) [Zygosaccharomyces parabailii]CDF91812.1 ZYBA0S14-01706g1_1 [Zygosaccharomyces bailii CLIB 213]CDH09801.1 related to nitroreductase HBN1 [Zygosaccharomyces bailii ISA1307]
MSAAHYLKAIASRRTVYALKPELPSGVTLEEVQAIVQAIIKDTPTSFNSQVNRAIILTGAEHKRVWDQVVKSIPSDSGKKRPASVRDEAFGSVIFFTDDKTTEQLQAKFPAWASAFPQFADHSSGAAQINTWTALKQVGIGGHLQHFNGYVKAALPKSIPLEWQVHAQLAFGMPAVDSLPEKTYIDNPVKVFS